uniref:Aquaporin n=1 Tax=Globisporangium ultimum (strain ATCC 200006 / CBS 805.95 / DAOM BR144) TaxID=431595 RepID=K3X6K7_GLOUD
MNTDEARVSQDYRAIEEAQKDLFTHEDEAKAKNRPTVVPIFPSCVGILVVGIGMAFSLISSAALNPARDFGPRLMLAIVGYDGVFSANGHYFWIPIVAPIAGGIVGAAVYILLILAHHPTKVGPQRFF